MLVLWRIQRWRKYYTCLQVIHSLPIILDKFYLILINVEPEKMLLTGTDLLIDETEIIINWKLTELFDQFKKKGAIILKHILH